jgi:hypothetical protein
MFPDIQGGFSPSHGVETSGEVWQAQLPLAGIQKGEKGGKRNEKCTLKNMLRSDKN